MILELVCAVTGTVPFQPVGPWTIASVRVVSGAECGRDEMCASGPPKTEVTITRPLGMDEEFTLPTGCGHAKLRDENRTVVTFFLGDRVEQEIADKASPIPPLPPDPLRYPFTDSREFQMCRPLLPYRNYYWTSRGPELVEEETWGSE